MSRVFNHWYFEIAEPTLETVAKEAGVKKDLLMALLDSDLEISGYEDPEKTLRRLVKIAYDAAGVR